MSEKYTEDSIRSLDWKEHIRLRPGMYIGKLGDGSSPDDGIYVLIKEIIDNSVDEFVMGNGSRIEVKISDKQVFIRDFGRGMPLGKVIDCVSKINTGAKYDSRVFKKAVGLNGVGSKAVNAMSSYFKVQSVREGKTKIVEYEKGELTTDTDIMESDEDHGTLVTFVPDEDIFGNFHFISEYVEKLLWNYVFLNNGLVVDFNGEKMVAKNGLRDLLEKNINGNGVLYPIIHIREEDLEFAFTHSFKQYGEEYYSFVNGQYTPLGGTHQQAFREAIVRTIRDFYGKDFDTSDIHQSVLAAVSIKIVEPVFESQTKTKLGSQHMEPEGQTIRNFVHDIVKRKLDNFLHRDSQTAEALLKRIQQSEKERKELAGIKKLAKESVKKASLHNKKLRDCRMHLNNAKDDKRLDSTLFITEGDSASGSITKSRNVNTQAVFSLKGKPLNCYGLSKKVVYENEEFNLLQAALNIEEGLENLRYNNIVIATDADVDGMHIRLLLLTFFLQFYPDLVKGGHLFILQTPLFRVRNKRETHYCYSEEERKEAMRKVGKNPEITRFKGLGEISPDEFKHFIGPTIRLDPVILKSDSSIQQTLAFYMGKNTPDRQNFIIENLRFEEDVVEEMEAA
ncbi:MAG: DNA topoisomerase IV subunit B [Bacteroidota bacterium]|nr:DNA topoisomerase IV subunit B [Bacteroidota bacterium]